MLSLVCGALLAAGVGCGGSPNNPDAGDGGGEQDAGPPQTYTYVMRTLTIEDSDSPDVPHTGFNLDNHFSGPTDPEGCNHQDFFSVIDPDQNRTGAMCNAMAVMNNDFCGGVDNQLPTLSAALRGLPEPININERVAAEINAGRLALLLQVADVNSLQNDSSVTVRILVGYPTFSDCGMLFNNGEFVIASQSLRMGGTSAEDALFSFQGEIVDGRLRVHTDRNATFNLPLPEIQGVSFALDLHAPALRVNLSEGGGMQGNLGGWVSGNDLVNAVIRFMPMQESAARQIISGLVDIATMDVPECVRGMGSSQVYGGISMGLGFTTVPARVSSMAPVSSRPMNSCGASSM